MRPLSLRTLLSDDVVRVVDTEATPLQVFHREPQEGFRVVVREDVCYRSKDVPLSPTSLKLFVRKVTPRPSEPTKYFAPRQTNNKYFPLLLDIYCCLKFPNNLLSLDISSTGPWSPDTHDYV